MLLVAAVQQNTSPLQKQRNQVSSVIIVTVLQAGRSVVRILAGARDFSVLEIVLTGSGPQPSSCSVGTMVLSW